MKSFTSDYRHTHVEIDVQDCELPNDELTRIQRELDGLAEELLEFPDSQLFLKIVHHPQIERYHAQAKLKLPGKTIVTGHYSPWLDDALMRCLGKLRRRAECSKQEPKHDAIVQAQRSEKLNEVEEVAAPTDPNSGELGRAVELQDYREFRRLMAGYEPWLRSEVAHWTLRYPRVEGMIGEEFDNDDIVEEILLTALESFAERPEEKTISQWMSEFIEPAMQELYGDPLEREAASFARTLSTPE